MATNMATNMTTLATEYIFQMYIDALVAKGLDKTLLTETFDEVNKHVVSLLSSSTFPKAEKVEKTATKKTATKKNVKVSDEVVVSLSLSDEESKPEKTEEAIAEQHCTHEFTSGKNKGKTCDKDVVSGTTLCKTHTKKKSKPKESKPEESKEEHKPEDHKPEESKAEEDKPEEGKESKPKESKCTSTMASGKYKGQPCIHDAIEGTEHCKIHTPHKSVKTFPEKAETTVPFNPTTLDDE